MPDKKKARMHSPTFADEYDPDQPAEDTRDMRRKLRTFEGEIKDKSTEDMTEIVVNLDGVFGGVSSTAEAIIDSKIVMGVTEAAGARARAMKSGSGAFDVDDFLQKLVTFMGGRASQLQENDNDDDDDEADFQEVEGAKLDWERVGRRAIAFSHRVPVSDFMLGPLSIEQKQRAAAKRSRLVKDKADEKKPQNITEDDITRSENETTKNVQVVNSILDGLGEAVNLFKFIVNPNDFGQSVENLFYLSFLIRDGKCAFEVTEEGEPTIYACDEPSQDEYANGLRKRQLVMELDMATWRRAVEVFNIREPLIPQRKKAETRIGNKWYG